MGKRGFQQQSEDTARMKGTYRKDRYVKKETKIEGLIYLESVPAPPDSLNNDGKRYWNTTLNGLIKEGALIAEIDLYLFETLCYNYQLLMEFEKEMREKGQYYTDNKGKTRVSPLLGMYSRTFRMFLTTSKMFGLTPASRANIKIKPKEEENDLLKYFSL